MLEEIRNVSYQYLRSKGYMASVGRIGVLECDFVARRAFGDCSPCRCRD